MPLRTVMHASCTSATRSGPLQEHAFAKWPDKLVADEKRPISNRHSIFFYSVTFLAFDPKITKVRNDRTGKDLN
jgi:hypothetical protein